MRARFYHSAPGLIVQHGKTMPDGFAVWWNTTATKGVFTSLNGPRSGMPPPPSRRENVLGPERLFNDCLPLLVNFVLQN